MGDDAAVNKPPSALASTAWDFKYGGGHGSMDGFPLAAYDAFLLARTKVAC